jgi:hypothetical protein
MNVASAWLLRLGVSFYSYKTRKEEACLDEWHEFTNLGIFTETMGEAFTVKNDDTRENRIQMEVICDANSAEEQVSGWLCYLEDKMSFPYKAKCVSKSAISPLNVGEKVVVKNLDISDECEYEMFVEISWSGRDFAVPLVQLKPIDADEDTVEAAEDWRYWKSRGYKFC